MWRGIFKVLPIIHANSHWRVVKGTGVDLFKDRWLCASPNLIAQPVVSSNTDWHPHPAYDTTINVDAATRGDRSVWGLIAGDQACKVLTIGAGTCEFSYPSEVEGCGVLQAVRLASSKHLSSHILCDASVVMSWFVGKVNLPWTIAHIVQEGMALLRTNPDVSLAHTSCKSNEEPVLEENNNTEGEDENDDGSLNLDGGFSVPDSNAFGHSFRDYEKESGRRASVEKFYRTNHIYQTFEFANKKKEEYGKLKRAVMSIWECCELLNEFVDESDPDLDEPQIEHLLQTAEAIRRDYPEEGWLHLTALIHDLGKVLSHPSFGGEPQWCVVGDTFPLGCAFDKNIVYDQYFNENPDSNDPVFRTRLGVYTENCGLDNVTMSWGHDEYMYLVMKENKTSLPPVALFIVRFHSFYALHRAGAYTYLMNADDKEMLNWLQIFNKYDLYSKSKVRINQEEVKPYYLSLINKYFPEKLRW